MIQFALLVGWAMVTALASALPSIFSLEGLLNAFVSVVAIGAHECRFRSFVLEVIQRLFVEFGMALVTTLDAMILANVF